MAKASKKSATRTAKPSRRTARPTANSKRPAALAVGSAGTKVSRIADTKSTKESKAARDAEAQRPVILPSPVPTDGKPRKNQAGMGTKELEFFRSLLLAKRREIVGDMSSMEHEALRSTTSTNLSNLPIHMADMGTDNYEQEFTLGLVEKDRQLLREINIGLAKIQNGTYGICEGTGKPISKPRLEAQPWAKYSIEHARQLERNGGGRR